VLVTPSRFALLALLVLALASGKRVRHMEAEATHSAPVAGAMTKES
jgi:hypothetical protein